MAQFGQYRWAKRWKLRKRLSTNDCIDMDLNKDSGESLCKEDAVSAGGEEG